MRLPESLPGSVFLLAFDPRRQRLTGQSYLCYTLRAAALTDLLLRNLIVNEAGKVRGTGRMRAGDPLLDALLARIAADEPRSWEAWVRRRTRPRTRVEVREQLATGGWITVEPRRFLGIFPTVKITVVDPGPVEQLRQRLVLALDGGPVDERERAILALANAAGMGTVVSWRQRRAHRHRLAELTALAGPAVPALRKVIRQAQAAAAAAGG